MSGMSSCASPAAGGGAVMLEALRFAGEVRDADGKTLGEARFWGAVERTRDRAPWSGWLHVTDLGTNELPPGRYRVRAADGWEAAFEPVVTKATRVFETDLLPITGLGDAPWPEELEEPPPYRPVWSDTPPRVADDRGRFASAPADRTGREYANDAGREDVPDV
jgi:hypothetical protein